MFKKLTEEEYARRAARAGKTAVFTEFLADRETPVAVLSRVGADEDVFLLESVAPGEQRGRFSYLGIEPRTVRTSADADILDELRAEALASRYESAPELPSFQGGAVGFVAYDAIGAFEPRVKPQRDGRTPMMAFMEIDKFLIFDNVRSTVTIAVILDNAAYRDSHEAYEAAQKTIAEIYARLLSAESIARLLAQRKARATGHAGEPCAKLDFKSEMTKEEFCEIVARCKEAIGAGEVIQIVPSQKFTVETDLDALSLYRALRLVNPSPYNFFIRIGAKTLIGSSPEELVKLDGHMASTAPIAGTRPRGLTPAHDRELESELRADAKERAEHVMLVDLARNDLGRVCETGSVAVENFAHVERYSHVMHLVSNVKGKLAKEYDAYDLLRSAFPAGTLTGAPKIRAMELIAEFEKSPRGIYGGAAGYFSLTGDMDFAIVIRTMVLENGLLTMRSGAGIVADSDPCKEYDETVNKAKAIFAAARLAGDMANLD